MSIRTKIGWVAVIIFTIVLAAVLVFFPQHHISPAIIPIPEHTISSEEKKLLFNIASAEELNRIPGIGLTLGQEIVSYRDENGLFSSYEELLLVPGIGKKKLEIIKNYYREKGCYVP